MILVCFSKLMPHCLKTLRPEFSSLSFSGSGKKRGANPNQRNVLSLCSSLRGQLDRESRRMWLPPHWTGAGLNLIFILSRMYGEFKGSFETVISLIKVTLRKWHRRIFVPWSLWASLQLLLPQTLTPLNQFSRPPSAGADSRDFPPAGGQGCLYQCRSVVTYESPVTSSSIKVPVSHTHVNTHEHTLGARGPSAPPVIPLVSSKAPLWIWHLFRGRLRPLDSFLSLPPTPAVSSADHFSALRLHEIIWDLLGRILYLFHRPKFLVYCSLNVSILHKAFGIFSSFPSPKGSIWSQTCLWGEDAVTLGPSRCPLLHLCQGKDRHWADLSRPDQKRRLWKPTRPHCPSLCGHSCLPSPPPCLVFFSVILSASAPASRWEQRSVPLTGLGSPH